MLEYLYSIFQVKHMIKYNQRTCAEVFSGLRKKCPYSEFFPSIFSRIRTDYGEIRSTFPYSVQMWENTDQKNSEGEHYAV